MTQGRVCGLGRMRAVSSRMTSRLAPHVGANLEVMREDTARMRPNPQTRPWVMTNLKTLQGLSEVVGFIEKRGLLNAQ